MLAHPILYISHQQVVRTNQIARENEVWVWQPISLLDRNQCVYGRRHLANSGKRRIIFLLRYPGFAIVAHVLKTILTKISVFTYRKPATGNHWPTGAFSPGKIIQNFCTYGGDSSFIWSAGTYCIIRAANSKCPKGNDRFLMLLIVCTSGMVGVKKCVNARRLC